MRILQEAIRAKDLSPAIALITKFLKSKTGAKVYAYPEPEVLRTASGTKLVGIRMFVSKQGYKSVRFNWKNVGELGSFGLVSVDYWDGSKTPQPIPSKHIEFDIAQSLVKVLPIVADVINTNGQIQDKGIFINESLSLQTMPMITDFAAVHRLNEANYGSGDISKTVANTVAALKQGISPGDQHKAGGARQYGPGWNKVIDTVKRLYPDIMQKQGVKVIIDTSAASKIDQKKILSALGADPDVVAYTATAGEKEVIEVPNTDEESVERITYEEQLQNLQTGIKLLMAGATNAIIVQGAGGVGKTQTVEDTLASLGKTDGDGFFKISGSISPSGLYRVLFEHRSELILSDDCDDLFKDQEGRNLLKAACDTKKIRKISWMKSGSKYIDPDDYDFDNPGDELPRYFDFKGKLIAISNLKLDKLDPDGAFRTRCYIIDIDPTNEELYAWMERIAPNIKLDVQYHLQLADRLKCIDILRSRKLGNKLTSLRSFVRAVNTMAGVLQQGGTEQEYTKFIKTYA